MRLSQKCQYALRAIFELAKHCGEGPVKIAQIGQTQAIPERFLEVILSELKQGRFVESRRGSRGGYLMARSPDSVAVGEVIRFVEGPFGPVSCLDDVSEENCPLYGDCVFLRLWKQVEEATSAVYDNTTFQDLMDEDARMRGNVAPSYVI